MDNQTELTPQVRARTTKGLFIPRPLLPVYALLLIAFGWFAGERWHSSAALDHPMTVLTQAVPSAIAQPHTAPVKSEVTTVAEKNAAESQKAAVQETPPEALASDELPALRYSAHVYASEDNKRSITLNGQRYHEGDSPAPNLVIEQIQQDVTIFNFNGEVFTLDALEDWPGGKVDLSTPSER
ncbi:type II secretion system assembly factor GspB [Serratia oryzae]|uniref:type II secretion system assembly factor GspB n=1 Tax=Serratia oryzae TaxID=2034155 RepID=UPI0012E0FE8D|nr:type II secretion system assembly factor GspB [Serratia oryzae]